MGNTPDFGYYINSAKIIGNSQKNDIFFDYIYLRVLWCGHSVCLGRIIFFTIGSKLLWMDVPMWWVDFIGFSIILATEVGYLNSSPNNSDYGNHAFIRRQCRNGQFHAIYRFAAWSSFDTPTTNYLFNFVCIWFTKMEPTQNDIQNDAQIIFFFSKSTPGWPTGVHIPVLMGIWKFWQ